MTTTAASRVAFLRDRVEVAERSRDRATFDVPFRQRQISLVKIDVPIEFPLYNLRSGRTHRAQTQWIEQNGRPKDFFADPEVDEAQLVQQELLTSMIQESGLADDLDRRDQRNPIVLTYDGFIVDGNRRVAALRSQGEAENVVAVVLPSDATVSEIFETELELQMARETRAAYDWVDQAVHLRYGIRELGEQVASVAVRMNVPEADVEAVLARLTLVDQYLEWAGAPDAYHKVPSDSEQSFIELSQRDGRQNFRNLPEPLRRAVRHGCFSVIDAEDGGYMDIRRVADSIRGQPGQVASRLRDRLPVDLRDRLDEPVDVPVPPDDPDDILSQLANVEPVDFHVPGAELANVLTDVETARRTAPDLMDIARELDEEQREAQSQLQPLRKIERALQSLRSVRVDTTTRSLDQLANRLAELEVEVTRISNEVQAAERSGQ